MCVCIVQESKYIERTPLKKARRAIVLGSGMQRNSTLFYLIYSFIKPGAIKKKFFKFNQ